MNEQSSHKKHNSEPLKDGFNRRIDYLRISVTDKCNLKCIYCTPSRKLDYFERDEILSDEEIVRFISIARKHGLRKVRITGGEPLMRKNIVSLVASIKETGIRDLSLTTNGILLAHIAAELKEAGLDRVNLSLDTLKADRYKAITKGGDIERVWDSIDAADSAGLSPVKINVVPIRGINEDEIPSFAELTMKNSYHIRFIEFMPASCSGVWSREKCVNASEVLKMISSLGEIEPVKFRGSGPSRNYRIKGAKGIVGVISPVSDHFCDHCNRLRLTADGRVRPCLFSKEEINIRVPMRQGISEDELDNLFCSAVRIKPRGHTLDKDPSPPSDLKSMSKIGG